MPIDKIERASKILLDEYTRIGDLEDIVKNKNSVLDRYREKFSRSHIKNLEWDVFSGFLKYENNKHWHGIDLQVKLGHKLKDHFSEIQAALEFLTNEENGIVDRFNRCNSIDDLGKAKITPILLVSFPDKYGVWNSISEWCLKTLGIWLDSYDQKSTKRLSEGQVYKYVNSTLNRLASKMNVDLWTLDAIFWYYYTSHQDQICLDLKEMETYSKKELNDIFSPELQYSSSGGRWGRTGVVSNNLGARTDYILFSISERFKNRQRPEEVSNDGRFDWVTQQKMKKGDTNQVVKIKNSKVERIRVLLFQKEKETEDEFSYFGSLTYEEEYTDEILDRRFIFILDSWLKIKDKVISTPGIPITNSAPSVDAELFFDTDKPEIGGYVNIKVKSKKAWKYNRDPNEEENKILGNHGEELVWKWERKKLEDYPKLKEKIKWVSKKDDTKGYDIRSFEPGGKEIFIEVKTTRGALSTPFIISANEYEVSKQKGDSYRLYRLYNYTARNGARVFVIEGSLEPFKPRPKNYTIDVRKPIRALYP